MIRARMSREVHREEALLRVPEITSLFWIIKGLSTALGESTSDYLVHGIGPAPAVLLGFAAFIAAMVIQFTRHRYVAWSYWLAVVMVGVFGTMAADVLHAGLDVPYSVSTAVFAMVLIVVFVVWRRVEGTLSIHSIDTGRREFFYWSAVVATFALGTAVGDLAAISFKLGYALSSLLFAGAIVLPAVGYARFGLNPMFAFWFAYVATRPLGASIADWLGKPNTDGGVGFGSGPVSLVLVSVIIALIMYLSVSRRDVQQVTNAGHAFWDARR